jgi:hypothetical protein
VKLPFATVGQVRTTSPLTIRPKGDDADSPDAGPWYVNPDYTPAVNDKVLIVKVGTGYIVVCAYEEM